MALGHVTVVVLGDIGRSPRMQYHATSFLKEGSNVCIVGYKGSKPLDSLLSNKKCTIMNLWETPAFVKNIFCFAAYIFKILWQVLTLSWILWTSPRPRLLLVQTPPAIPALAVCWLFCRVVKAKFIIDWHNYSFSIMALKHGKHSFIVLLSEVFEGFFGRRADGCLCVTKGMKEDLMKRWNVRAVTLYDRPPEHFGTHSPDERQTLWVKYKELTTLNCEDRSRLLVSSTSWTEDEDFAILFSALREYDCSKKDLPKLTCVITGKGPLRDRYMAKVKILPWSRVSITTLWLDAEDYPRLLASADLGVSLHTSSSGLDLPMKVVDMFGCGLPVAAFNFNCLNELVRHEENGLVFHDSRELSSQLQDWFQRSNESRAHYKKAIQQFQSLRWHENWSIQALPLFQSCQA